MKRVSIRPGLLVWLLVTFVAPVEVHAAQPNMVVRSLGKFARTVGGRVDRCADWLETKGDRLAAKEGFPRFCGKFIRGSGKTLKLVAGMHTLLNTSFEGGFGLTFATPLTKIVNFSTNASVWTGSIAYHEGKYKDHIINRGIHFNTPLGGVDYTKVGKMGGYINALPFLSGYKDTRSHGVYVGVGGAAELGVGEVGPGKHKDGTPIPARGPFVHLTGCVPLLPLGIINLYLTVDGCLYSPLLRPITKPMDRPAMWLHQRGERTKHKLAKRWSSLKRLFHRGDRASR